MNATRLLTIGAIGILVCSRALGADIAFERVDDDDQSAEFATYGDSGFSGDHAYADDATSGAVSSGQQGSSVYDEVLAENADTANAASGNTHADVEVTLVAENTTTPEATTYVPNVLCGIAAIDDIVAPDSGDWGWLAYYVATSGTGVFEAQTGPGTMDIALSVTVDAFETPYMAYFYVANQTPDNPHTGS